MISISPFLEFMQDAGINFVSGVPDSLTAKLISELEQFAEANKQIKLIPAANEGLAVSMCIGSFLGNGRPGIVFMQNSGLGNAINPLLSLVHKSVFNIPLILLVGWRGEPAFPDEPQHRLQGSLTLNFLDMMNAERVVIKENDDFLTGITLARHLLATGQMGIFAFVFSREAFK